MLTRVFSSIVQSYANLSNLGFTHTQPRVFQRLPWRTSKVFQTQQPYGHYHRKLYAEILIICNWPPTLLIKTFPLFWACRLRITSIHPGYTYSFAFQPDDQLWRRQNCISYSAVVKSIKLLEDISDRFPCNCNYQLRRTKRFTQSSASTSPQLTLQSVRTSEKRTIN